MSVHTPPLAPHHYAMLAQDSGIADDVISERGYRSITGAEGYGELKALGFAKVQSQTPGLLVPLWTTDGRQIPMVYRPDAPRLSRDGKPIKYEIPKGVGVRLDCPPRCRPQLADPSVPLWMTEGQKKADSLASHGAVAISILGVWSFIGKNTFGGNTLLTDFDHVAWNGREVRLCFDSDVVDKPSVRKALDRLSAHLTNNWLRVLGTAERSQIDQRIRHQLHAIVPLLDAFKAQQQPLELVFPRKGPLDTHA